MPFGLKRPRHLDGKIRRKIKNIGADEYEIKRVVLERDHQRLVGFLGDPGNVGDADLFQRDDDVSAGERGRVDAERFGGGREMTVDDEVLEDGGVELDGGILMGGFGR